MKIIAFEVDHQQLLNNRTSFTDIIRSCILEQDEQVLEQLDYEEDQIFLEPALVYYFLADKKRSDVDFKQYLSGYFFQTPSRIKVKADAFGMIDVPAIGYFVAYPDFTGELVLENGGYFLRDNTGRIETKFLSTLRLPDSPIRICYNTPLNLDEADLGATLTESAFETVSKHKDALFAAWKTMSEIVPDFVSLLNETVKEVCLYNSPDQNSFGSISYHGTGFFNVNTYHEQNPGGEDEVTEVFFIDDIAHQCGHVIYNMLTLDTESYLTIHKSTPINTLIDAAHEKRSVYSAFHGLFTYSCILFCLDKLIDDNQRDELQLLEAKGRLGFYLKKFTSDVKTMSGLKIFTPRGDEFIEMFKQNLSIIQAKHLDTVSSFDYSNQTYIFNRNKFLAINSVHA